MHRIDPLILDRARNITGSTSDEKLGVHLGISGTSVRNLRHGRNGPSLDTLVKLREMTGIPIDSMLARNEKAAA